MQLGFYFDQSRCSGCYTCVVACKDWYDISAGPVSWMHIRTAETGTFPKVSVSFFVIPCYHCSKPSCLSVCPVEAIRKLKENGIVVVDQEVCLGLEVCGGLCQKACPFGSPQFGNEPNAKMEKCHFCLERWEEGKKPICVEACPMRALDAGPLDTLQLNYEHKRLRKEVEGFIYNKHLKPSFMYKSK